MALELRLQQKLTQQLVMTPQLQHAIKLLQLNHLEMADTLREELEQNPVLEEREDRGEGEEQAESSSSDSGEADASPTEIPTDTGQGAAEGETAEIAADLKSVLDTPEGATPEPTSSEVSKEIDWEAYLDSYSYSLPPTAGSSSAEDLPSFEATLTKPMSLHEYLRWQIHMQEFSQEEAQVAAMLVEEINEDGYLAGDAVETVVEELGVAMETVETVIREMQHFDPPGVAARDLRECLLVQCQYLHRENELVVVG